jgi:hypothetical protein
MNITDSASVARLGRRNSCKDGVMRETWMKLCISESPALKNLMVYFEIKNYSAEGNEKLQGVNEEHNVVVIMTPHAKSWRIAFI